MPETPAGRQIRYVALAAATFGVAFDALCFRAAFPVALRFKASPCAFAALIAAQRFLFASRIADERHF
jgi:hypothetical protein